MTPRTFGGGAVARMLGVTERQLRYWRQTRLVTPPYGSNGFCRYATSDLVKIQLILELRKMDVSIQRMRDTFKPWDQLMAQVSEPYDVHVGMTRHGLIVGKLVGSTEPRPGIVWLDVPKLLQQILTEVPR